VRPGRASDHSPPSTAAVMEEQGYTSTHPLDHTGPLTVTLYLLPFYLMNIGLISFEKKYKTCKDVTNCFHTLYCRSVLRRIYAIYKLGQHYLTDFEERERETNGRKCILY